MLNKKNLNESLNNLAITLEHIIAEYHTFMTEKDEDDKSMVIALNGRYGSGKTTFIKLFTEHLQAENFATSYEFSNSPGFNPSVYQRNANKVGRKVSVSVIHYDAWKNDDADDPLASLIAQICQMDPTVNSPTIKKFKEAAIAIIQATQKPMLDLLKKMIGVGINPAVETISKKFSENIFDESITHLEKQERIKTDFKNALANIGQIGNEQPPLKILFIDELDRCRPSFAVKFLERIKHLFNAENTIFVLTIDRYQFTSIIKKVYGDAFDANHYLSRFFDFELKIPVHDDFFRKLMEENSMDPSHLAPVIDFYDMQAREVVKFCKLVKFLNSIKASWNLPSFYFLAGLKTANSFHLEMLKKIDLSFSILGSVDVTSSASMIRVNEELNKLMKILNPQKNLDDVLKKNVPLKQISTAFLNMLAINGSIRNVPAVEIQNAIKMIMQAKNITAAPPYAPDQLNIENCKVLFSFLENFI